MAELKVAGRQPTEKPVANRFWSELRGYAEALIIAFFIVTFVFNTVGVVGSSMRPNLHGGIGASNVFGSLLTGDRVFIPKYDTWLRRIGVLGEYRRGDVVVVREPANAPTAQQGGRRPFFIKRIIGVPGDHIRLEAGQVFVNGLALDQGFITSSGEIRPDPVHFPVVTQEAGEINGMVINMSALPDGTPYPELPLRNQALEPTPITDPRIQLYYGGVLNSMEAIPENAPENTPFILDHIVPEGMYFVMGDNRENARGGSEDSRYFGPIEAMSIGGKATAVIWPPRREGTWNWRTLERPFTFSDVPDAANN